MLISRNLASPGPIRGHSASEALISHWQVARRGLSGVSAIVELSPQCGPRLGLLDAGIATTIPPLPDRHSAAAAQTLTSPMHLFPVPRFRPLARTPRVRLDPRECQRRGEASAARIAPASSSGASSGTKWPTPASGFTVASEKKSDTRSPHSGGNSGSNSGQRIVVGNSDRIRQGRAHLRDAPGDGARTCAVPRDRRRERPGRGVQADEAVERGVRQLKRRPRPMRPEVPKIGANRRWLPVEDLLDQAQLMKRLVPELLLRLGREDAVADAWYRRRDDRALAPGPDTSEPAPARRGCRRRSRRSPPDPARDRRSVRLRCAPARRPNTARPDPLGACPTRRSRGDLGGPGSRRQ